MPNDTKVWFFFLSYNLCKQKTAGLKKQNERKLNAHTTTYPKCSANEYLKRNTLTHSHISRILIESIESTRNVHLKLHNFYTGQTMQILHQWYKLCDSKCVVQSDQSAFEWETKPTFNEVYVFVIHQTRSKNNNDLAIILACIMFMFMCEVTKRWSLFTETNKN